MLTETATFLAAIRDQIAILPEQHPTLFALTIGIILVAAITEAVAFLDRRFPSLSDPRPRAQRREDDAFMAIVAGYHHEN